MLYHTVNINYTSCDVSRIFSGLDKLIYCCTTSRLYQKCCFKSFESAQNKSLLLKF